MKRIRQAFAISSAIFILSSFATGLLANENNPPRNFPQEVARMKRRGWALYETQRILHGDDEYTVAIYHWENSSPQWRMALFQLYHRYGNGALRIIETGRDMALHTARSDFLDLNNDGSPEAAIELFNGGNCWGCTRLEIYTLHQGKASIFYPSRQGETVLTGIADIDQDGFPELLLTDTQWEFYQGVCHACSPYVGHYLTWDPIKERYKEDPLRFREEYEKDIRKTLAALEKENYPEYYLGNAVSVFLNYQMLGEPRKGWAEFEWLLLRVPAERELVEGIRDDLHIRFKGNLPY